MTRHSKVGHIYVALLDGGIVKTGKTKRPKSRISKSGFGNRRILDYWVSGEFVGYSDAESEMLRFLGGVGSVAFGREYFSGVDYSVAVEKARECFSKRIGGNVLTQKRIEKESTESSANRVVDKFYGVESVSDVMWANHVDSFKSTAAIVKNIISGRGLVCGSLEPSNSIGGISLFELSLLICSYQCPDGAIEYFSDVTVSVSESLQLRDNLFVNWFSSFESDMKCEIAKHKLRPDRRGV